MTILELITKLDRDTHIIVRYNYGDEILDFKIKNISHHSEFLDIILKKF